MREHSLGKAVSSSSGVESQRQSMIQSRLTLVMGTVSLANVRTVSKDWRISMLPSFSE
jgi:hypothetical protein